MAPMRHCDVTPVPPMTAEQAAAWRDAPIILVALKLANLRSVLNARG